jgi:hypothetical protein
MDEDERVMDRQMGGWIDRRMDGWIIGIEG